MQWGVNRSVIKKSLKELLRQDAPWRNDKTKTNHEQPRNQNKPLSEHHSNRKSGARGTTRVGWTISTPPPLPPCGKLSFRLVGFRLKILLIQVIFFCVITYAMNTNETALITIDAALNLLTNHKSLGREAIKLRNMSICSDLMSLVSYLFICFFISCCSCKVVAVFSTRKKIPRTRRATNC